MSTLVRGVTFIINYNYVLCFCISRTAEPAPGKGAELSWQDVIIKAPWILTGEWRKLNRGGSRVENTKPGSWRKCLFGEGSRTFILYYYCIHGRRRRDNSGWHIRILRGEINPLEDASYNRRPLKKPTKHFRIHFVHLPELNLSKFTGKLCYFNSLDGHETVK